MSMTILPEQPQKTPKAAKAPKAPKEPKGPRQLPELTARREYIYVAIVLVLVVAGAFLFWPGGSSAKSTAPLSPPATQRAADAPPPSASAVNGKLPRVAPKTYMRNVLAIVRRQHGVHLSLTGKVNTIDVSATGDLGPHSGQMTESIAGQAMQVRMLDGVVYVDGSAALLHAFLKLPQSVADLGAGQWIAIHRGDEPYRHAHGGLSILSISREKTFGMHGPFRLSGPNTIGTAKTIGVSGTDGHGKNALPETVWVQAAAPHLPVQDTESGDNGTGVVSQVTTYSHWGDKVRITAPSGAVAYATLVAETR